MSWKKYIVLLLLSLCTWNSYAGEALIPYRQGAKWGLCTKARKIIIPATYKEISFLPPYYFATDAIDKVMIFDLDGKKLGSCDDFERVTGTDSFLVWRETELIPKDNISAPFRLHFSAYEKGYDLFLLHKNNLSRLTDGTITGSFAHPGRQGFTMTKHNIFFVTKNEKTGVYHLNRNSWIIPPQYDSFIVPEGERIIAYHANGTIKTFGYNGQEFPANRYYKDSNIYQIFDNGNFLRAATNVPGTTLPQYAKIRKGIFEIVSAEGKVLQDNLTGISVLPANQLIYAGKGTSNGAGNLYNSQGQLIMEQVVGTNMSKEGLLAFNDSKGRLKTLYSEKNRDFIWNNTFPDHISVSPDGYMFPGISAGDSFFVLDDAGKVLMSYDRRKQSPFMLKREGQLQHKTTTRYYLALRNNTDEKFRYYDEQYRELKDIDSILFPVSNASVLAYRKKGKWIVADHNLQALTEAFDSARYTYSYKNFMLFKEGQQYIYLVNAQKLLPVTGYDDAVGYAHHDAFLGLKYGTVLPANQSKSLYTSANCQVDLLDAKGKVQYSMHNNEQAYFDIEFQLSANNLIIATGGDSRIQYFKITDPTNPAKKFERSAGYFNAVKDYQGMPVLLTWYNPDDKTSEILTATSFSPVPLEKSKTDELDNRLFYRYAPKDFVNGSNIIRTIEVTEIREKRNPNYRTTYLGQGERVRTEIVIGYISLDGTCYFD